MDCRQQHCLVQGWCQERADQAAGPLVAVLLHLFLLYCDICCCIHLCHSDSITGVAAAATTAVVIVASVAFFCAGHAGNITDT